MKKTLTTAIVLSLSACSTLPQIGGGKAAEIVWQTSNAYDWSQTVNTARRPDCYIEKDPVTRAMFGSHPSSAEVGVGWALQATLHLAISKWIDSRIQDTDSDAWRGVAVFWYALTFWNTGHNIADNSRIGLKPFGYGSNCDRGR